MNNTHPFQKQIIDDLTRSLRVYNKVKIANFMRTVYRKHEVQVGGTPLAVSVSSPRRSNETRLLKITTGHATIRLKGGERRLTRGRRGRIRDGRGFAIIYNEETFGTAGSLIARDNYC